MIRFLSDDRIDEVMAVLGLDPNDSAASMARALVDYVAELGATTDEIIAAARVEGLGPLALDLAIRPPGQSMPLDEFIATSGLEPDFVSQLWLALGLPEASPVAFPVTPDLAEALRVLSFLTEMFGVEAVLGFSRVIGSSSERIADALASATRVGVEVPQRGEGMPYEDVVREYSTTARELLPVLWDSIGAVFRRHLVLVSYEGFDLEKSHHAVTLQRAVGFIDLVGSTETLRTQSVEQLAASVNQFERLIGDRVTKAGGRLVKLIGDEAMFAFVDLRMAIETCIDLIEASPNPVRVGLAFGEVVAMHGDYFGPVVNLAARLVSVSAPSTVLVSDQARHAASGLFEFDDIETGALRGFPDVTTAYRAERRPR
jgi:class 3 adenylate cyclase